MTGRDRTSKEMKGDGDSEAELGFGKNSLIVKEKRLGQPKFGNGKGWGENWGMKEERLE